MLKGTFKDLNSRYEAMTAVVLVDAVFAKEMVGGQPADEEGIRQFVIHHRYKDEPNVTQEEIDKEVRRIMKEELESDKEENKAGEEDELEEKEFYGLRAVRADEFGPWIGDWMVKANLKNAASRNGLFTRYKGLKGGFAEAGRVHAHGISAQNPDHLDRVYIRDAAGTGPAKTRYEQFMGRVRQKDGTLVSIIHDAEVVIPGSRFEYEFRFMNDNLTQKPNEYHIADVIAVSCIVGIGSARSLERGKFRIENFSIDLKSARFEELTKERREAARASEEEKVAAKTAKKAGAVAA